MSGAAFLIFSGLLEELCGPVSYSTIGGHLILNPGHQGQSTICRKNHMYICSFQILFFTFLFMALSFLVLCSSLTNYAKCFV